VVMSCCRRQQARRKGGGQAGRVQRARERFGSVHVSWRLGFGSMGLGCSSLGLGRREGRSREGPRGVGCGPRGCRDDGWCMGTMAWPCLMQI
jgi:hypothetical protein